MGVAVTLIAVTKPGKSNLTRKGLSWLTVQGQRPPWQGSPEAECEAECEAADRVCSQEAGGMEAGARLTFSPLVRQSRISA